MNKIITTIISVLMIACFYNTASATAIGPTGEGATISISDSGGGPTLDYTPSPGTIMQALTSGTKFTIASCNGKADEDGIMYILVSGNSVIYQKQQAADSDGSLTVTIPGAGSSDTSFVAKE